MLNKLEVAFFAYVQARKCRAVASGQIGAALGLDSARERKLLSRLSRRGLITRVRPGLYLVPSTLPPGGKWSPGEALALATFMADRGGRYQLCGPNAFNRYGWDEQIPNRLYVYNNRLSGDRRVGSVDMTFIKTADNRLGAIETITTPGGIALNYSNKARALMDAVYDWSRFNGIPRAYGWIKQEMSADNAMAAALVEVSVRYGNQGTLRRIGMLLEQEGVIEPLLRRVAKAINPSSALIAWVPNKPKRGKINKRWGVVLNDK